MISAYSKFDVARAHAIKDLPSAQDVARVVDVMALGASLNTFSNRYVKKSNKPENSLKSPKGVVGDELLDKRKRKNNKKKNKPAKNPDAPVDPERWLSQRERSYYRGKRKDKRKEIGKGTQGAAAAFTDGIDPAKSQTPPASEVGSPRPGSSTASQQVAPPPQGSCQQKPQAAKKRRKRKEANGRKYFLHFSFSSETIYIF